MSNDELMSMRLSRALWRANGLLWLRETTQLADFNINNCLDMIEADPTRRDAALAVFWSIYFSHEIPPELSELQIQRIYKLLDLNAKQVEEVEKLAFVKLHLEGSLAMCLLRPDFPVREYPSITLILEKMKEAIELSKPPEIDVGDPCSSGKQLLENDLFGFSLTLISGICHVELALRRADEGKFEEALELISSGAWDICATTTEAGPPWGAEGTPGLQPYLPHSGNIFNIQEAVNIFEGLKEHAKDINNWENVRLYCEVIRYLNNHNLYDWLDNVIDAQGDDYGAGEYWYGAMSFCSSQVRIISPDHYILTRDIIERAETKERLRRDFLPGKLWDLMGPEAQKVLIDAEIHWIHGKLDDMVKDIRPLLEVVLSTVFPLLQPMVEKRYDPRLILTRMRDELQQNQIVRASVDSLKINSHEKVWVKDELPNFLQKVIDTRNYFEKEQLRPGSDQKQSKYLGEALTIHNELLGIGYGGVLPRILKIKQTYR